MYLFACYVPKTCLERLKSALFAAGAGRLGNYDCCSFEVEGTGQFRPLPGSNAFIGRTGEIERVAEVKVEMIVEDACRERVVEALKRIHPYEEPAYHLIPVVS